MLRTTFAASIVLSVAILSVPPFCAQDVATKSESNAKDNRPPIRKCWEYLFESGEGQIITGQKDKLFISGSGGRLRATYALTNDVLWMSELGGRIDALLPVAGIGVFVVTSSIISKEPSLSTLRLLNSETGLVKFAVQTQTVGKVFLAYLGSRIVVIDQSGSLSAFDVNSGASVWQTKSSGGLTATPATGDNIIAVATDAKKIDFVSVGDGSQVSSTATGREMKTLTFRTNQMLVAGDDRGNVTNYRNQTGAVWWKFKSGARVGTIIETDDGVLVGSFDNFLYMISKYSGDVKWKRRLNGRVLYRPLISKKELFVTVSGQDEAVVIDIDNGKIIEQIKLGEERFPVSDPIFTEIGTAIFPVAGGLIAFSSNGCK